MSLRNIQPYKNRTIDPTKKVRVYRCLNRKGFTFSVAQNGYVVGHTENIILKDVNFVLYKKGQERCRRTGVRNVHAHLLGNITEHFPKTIFRRFQYNPTTPINGFYDVDDFENITHSDCVIIRNDNKGELMYLR